MKGVMPVLRLKSCPRCSGDQVLEHDYCGWYLDCLQCGHHVDVSDPRAFEALEQLKRLLVVASKVGG